METLGAYLKKNREQRGVSLEEMASNTKINISVISFLEEDRFDKLPASVFVKGFIKSYLGYLGLNPKEAVLFYELISGEAQKKPKILSPVTEQQNNQSDKNNEKSMGKKVYNIKFSQRSLVIFGSVSIAIIIVLMYFIIFPSSSTDDISEYRKRMLLRMAPQPATQPVPQQEVVATLPVVVAPTPTPPSPPVVVKATVPVISENPQKVILKVQQDAWFKAQIDDGKPFEFLLRKGNVKKLDAKKVLKIFVGDTSVSSIEYQGELLKDLAQQGRTRSFVFPGLDRWKDAAVQ